MFQATLLEKIIGFFTGGWVTVKKDDPRFRYQTPVRSEGDESKKPTQLWTNRKKWDKILVVEVTGSGFIGCITFKGDILVCLKHHYQWGDQVALRIGRESADFVLLVPKKSGTIGYIRELGYVQEGDLECLFPKAHLI